jgi:Spy/CpxP family protein refolding chaperone
MTIRSTLASIAALALLTACGSDAPTRPNPSENDVVVTLEGSVLGLTGYLDGAAGIAGNTPALPPDLALTDEQRATIAALVDAFQQSQRADREALLAIERRALEARRERRSIQEIEAIRAEGHAIRMRMEEAAGALRRAIHDVLTAEQRDWLRANGSGERPCMPGHRLTAEQQAQIQTLMGAFMTQHAADRQAIEQALAQARAARAAGASDADVRAIIQTVREAQRRLEAAHAQLQLQIRQILTAGQSTSGCFVRNG